MDELGGLFRSVVDTMNPYSPGNITLYFLWLVVYTFTAMAIWRCENRWIRLLCFLINQLFAIGVIISQTIAIILAIEYWIHSLVVLLVVIVLSWLLFRRPRARPPRGHPATPEYRDNIREIEGQYGQSAQPGGTIGDRDRGV